MNRHHQPTETSEQAPSASDPAVAQHHILTPTSPPQNPVTGPFSLGRQYTLISVPTLTGRMALPTGHLKPLIHFLTAHQGPTQPPIQ